MTSPGLTGAVTLDVQPGSGNQAPLIGHGKAAGKTGKFNASFHCDGGPNLPAASGAATRRVRDRLPADHDADDTADRASVE